jgi:hydroxycarboxylate dehydrogenase B
MPTVPAESLRTVSRGIFEGLGADGEDARTVADVLVEANLAGHDSHGVIRVPQYADSVRAGDTKPAAALTTVRETAATTIHDAHWGFGAAAMSRALAEAMDKARDLGMHAFGIHNCNHIGRLGHYSDIAARAGFVPIMTVNSTGSGAAVAPFGGKQGKLGTNPLSVAFPTAGDPMLMDMTSSIVAEGKIRVRRNSGESLPEGWILDRHGVPSTEPADFYGPPRGAILPFGGPVAHKGYALSMMAELLSGTLTGAGNVMEREGHIGNGVFCLLMHVGAFRAEEDFRDAASRLGAYVKDCDPADGVDEVLLPGEPEHRTRQARSASGIVVDETTWAALCDEAGRHGVAVPGA